MPAKRSEKENKNASVSYGVIMHIHAQVHTEAPKLTAFASGM